MRGLLSGVTLLQYSREPSTWGRLTTILGGALTSGSPRFNTKGSPHLGVINDKGEPSCQGRLAPITNRDRLTSHQASGATSPPPQIGIISLLIKNKGSPRFYRQKGVASHEDNSTTRGSSFF